MMYLARLLLKRRLLLKKITIKIKIEVKLGFKFLSDSVLSFFQNSKEISFTYIFVRILLKFP